MANSYQILVFGLWDHDHALHAGHSYFYCSSLFPKETTQGCAGMPEQSIVLGC